MAAGSAGPTLSGTPGPLDPEGPTKGQRLAGQGFRALDSDLAARCGQLAHVPASKPARSHLTRSGSTGVGYFKLPGFEMAVEVVFANPK